MSTSASGARASSSSQRSPRVLESLSPRTSGSYSEYGESSRHSELLDDGRPALDGTNDKYTGVRLRSSSPSRARRSGDYDLGSLKVNPKSGRGGFLLSDNFKKARDPDPTYHSWHHPSHDGKGKSRADEGSQSVQKKRAGHISGGMNGSIHNSPLSKVTIGHGDGQDSPSSIENDGTTFGPSAGSVGPRPSQDMSQESHVRPAEQSLPSNSSAPTPVTGGIDPNQIVNMALRLSESRRRNLSGGQLSSQPVSGRRVASARSATANPALQGGYQSYGPGSSLRQYLRQQRRISPTISPGAGKPSGIQHMSSSHPATNQVEPFGSPEASHARKYSFSAATLSRTEKAKQYIELSAQYRYLLENLPPLKPDASAPGNSVHSVSSVPGTSSFEPRKQSSHASEKSPLARPYNPLQLIRNRKLRARTRSFLNPDTPEFENVPQVYKWLDAIEDAAKEPAFRGDDRVALPPYPLDAEPTARESHMSSQSAHRRNESTASTRKRPRTDWHTSPAEMLADAFWLEQGSNKFLIEDRHGNKIFPHNQRLETLQARPSYESRPSGTGSVPFSIDSYEGEDVDAENQRQVERGRKRHIASHNDSANRLKHVLNRARGRSASSSSNLSVSDRESEDRSKRPRLPLTTSFTEENAGSLERQMDRMLDVEADDVAKASSVLASPGTPNKWGTVPSFEHTSRIPPNGSAWEGRPLSTEIDVTDRGPKSHLPLNGEQVRPNEKHGHPEESHMSVEEQDSTNPNSPVSVHYFPAIGSDLTPPPPTGRKHSPTRKTRRAILPFIRSDGSRDSRKHDANGPFTEDFDASKSSRQASNEEPLPRSSLESASGPQGGKQLFSSKTNESLNSFSAGSSSRSKEARDNREPESTVRRLFKGGRLGELVRAEGARIGDAIRKRDSTQEIIEQDSALSDSALEQSDSDEDLDAPLDKQRQHGKRANGNTPKRMDTRRWEKTSNFHIDNLPIFKSSNAQSEPSRPSTPSGPTHDHITMQQQLLRQRNRSPRLDLLAPPNLDTSQVSSRTSISPSINMTHTTDSSNLDSRRSSHGFPQMFHVRSRSRTNKRLTAILDMPGTVGAGGMPPTALSKLRKERSASRSPHADKRQWSISDQPARPPSIHRSPTCVTKADVARVQALLLCSGVRAAELAKRAHRPREKGPSAFLIKAAETAGADLSHVCVPLKEEHVLAGRLLRENLESETGALHESTRAFKESTIAQLHHRLQDLRGVVESCADRARSIGDEAVGFGAEVTGRRGIEVRKVMDSLEKLVRARRRRLRWLRRIGFGLLEWVVLLFIWWVWFVVVVIRMIWTVFRGFGSAVRWVLFLK